MHWDAKRIGFDNIIVCSDSESKGQNPHQPQMPQQSSLFHLRIDSLSWLKSRMRLLEITIDLKMMTTTTIVTATESTLPLSLPFDRWWWLQSGFHCYRTGCCNSQLHQPENPSNMMTGNTIYAIKWMPFDFDFTRRSILAQMLSQLESSRRKLIEEEEEKEKDTEQTKRNIIKERYIQRKRWESEWRCWWCCYK